MEYRYLVTGGAGFIGVNYVHRLLSRGEQVVVYDNLSRAGADRNVAWLRDRFGADSFTMVVDDVRNAAALASAAATADVIVHLAAQVAVTTSITDPRADFECNALGTFNVLEAARQSPARPMVLYASTNKVYGALENAPVIEEATRYRFADLPDGVPETWPLDFHSPYGCSKGAGDQYVRDYHRLYGLPTVVLRQSCIYGPHQFGIEDQGWLAWFVIAAMTGRPITIFGDGKQVRDLLYIDDLLDLYDLAVARIDEVAGQVLNVGGGREQTLSVWQEFGPRLEQLLGTRLEVAYEPMRAGDQPIFIADISAARQRLGWQPQTGVDQGIGRLVDWVRQQLPLPA